MIVLIKFSKCQLNSYAVTKMCDVCLTYVQVWRSGCERMSDDTQLSTMGFVTEDVFISLPTDWACCSREEWAVY